MPKREDMKTGKSRNLSPEIENADVADVLHSYPVRSEASNLYLVKLQFGRVLMRASWAFC